MELLEEGVVQGSLDRDSLRGLHLHHLSQKVHGQGFPLEVLGQLLEFCVALNFPFWESDLHLGEVHDALPVGVGGGAQALEDGEDLADLGVPVEEGLSMGDFEEDAADRPDVDGGAVDLRSEQDLRCSVPESDYLMGITLERKSETSSEPKVCNFDLGAIFGDQDVAGLEVSVHDSALVAVEEPLQELPHDLLGVLHGERTLLLFEELLHVHIEILELEVEAVRPVDDLEESNDVRVIKLSEDCHLSHGGAGDAFVGVFDLNFFESHNL